MATLNSVITKLRNLLSSLNTKTGRSDATFNAAINALPSKKTYENVSVSGTNVTIPAGIYFSQVDATADLDPTSITVIADDRDDTVQIRASGGSEDASTMFTLTVDSPEIDADYKVTATATLQESEDAENPVSISQTSVSLDLGESTIGGEQKSTGTADYTIGYGKQRTISAGYYPASRIIRNSVTSGSCTVSGGGLSVTNNYSGTPTVDITLDGQTTSGAAITDTKPSSGYYLTIGASSSALSGTTKVTRANITDTHTEGYISAKSATTVISSTTASPTVTVNKGTKTEYVTLPTGGCTVAGGGLSVTNNYSGTPTVDITLDGQTTSGVAITDTKPSSGYYLTLGASSSALSGTTKVTRANITDTHTAGYIPAKSATNVISSTTASPTVTVNKGTKTEYVTIPTATFSTSGKTVTSSTAGYVPANTPVGTVSDGSVSNPSITVDSTGKITASATKTAGYITAGTASNTKQLTARTSSSLSSSVLTVTAPAGYYHQDATKTLTDNYLKAENIKENVTIFGVKGSYKGGASVGTCTVKLGIDTMEWYANNNVRVFYTSYSSGAFNTNVVQTSANATSTITLSNVVCGSAISVWTQVYAYISPSTYTKYTDEYNHCLMCPNSPGQTITIDLLENS